MRVIIAAVCHHDTDYDASRRPIRAVVRLFQAPLCTEGEEQENRSDKVLCSGIPRVTLLLESGARCLRQWRICWLRSGSPGPGDLGARVAQPRGHALASCPDVPNAVVQMAGFDGPSLSASCNALCRTSKMTAVDQPNSSTPFIAVIGARSFHSVTGTTSPYPRVVKVTPTK